METNRTPNTVSIATRDGTLLDTRTLNDEERMFEQWLDTVIIGQPLGKQAARRGLRRSMSKLRTGSQPHGAFIFLGPTSCGKSEIVYRFVEYVHGDRRCLLKIDGSEYMFDSNLTKLTGATNQWVGRTNKNAPDYKAPLPSEKDTTCELSQHNISVYSRYHSKTGRKLTIILVDEWDKACREFNDIWLSIMRDGRYTNGGSDELEFGDCIIFFTGNLGSRAVEEEKDRRDNPMGFRGTTAPMSRQEIDTLITKHLKEFAPPEFRARVDELGGVVIFDALTPEQVFEVCGVKVRESITFAREVAGIELVIGEDVKRWLLKQAEDNLARVNGGLKTHVIDVVDNELIKGTVVDGDTVTFLVPEATNASELLVRREPKTTQLFVVAPGDAALTEALAAHPLPGVGVVPLRTDEMDADALARLHPSRRRPSEVDKDEALRRVKEGLGQGENSDTAAKGEEPVGRVFQPFLITAILSDEAAVTAFRAKIVALSAKYGFTKMHEEIDPATVQSAAGQVQAVMVKTHVVALIERMSELKGFWPQLNIRVEEVVIPG